MGKISASDKMRIQTLCERLGYRRIVSKFSDKQLNWQSVKNICRLVDQRGSATERKPGSRRWKTAISKDDGQHRTSWWFELLTRRRTGNQQEHTQYCQTPEYQWEECSAHCEVRSVTLGVSSCSSSDDQRCNETEETGALQTTAASTDSDGLQACVFHWWEGILP